MSKRKNSAAAENEPEAKKAKLSENAEGDAVMTENSKEVETTPSSTDKPKASTRGAKKANTPASKPPQTRSKSPLRAKVKPVRSGLKRMSTMEETANEAMAFLEAIGSKKLLDTESTLPETRGRKQARLALSDMLNEDDDDKKDLITEKEERARLHTVYQLIDFEGNKVIGEEEVAELMRSMGKKPEKAKVRKLLEDVKPKTKGQITENEFVEFMIEKRRKKTGFKPEPQPVTSSPRRSRSKSPSKKVPSPRKSSPSARKSSPKKATPKRASPKRASPKRSSPKSNIRSAGGSSAPSVPQPTPTTPQAAPPTATKPKNDLLKFYSTTAHTKDYGLGRDNAFCDFSILVYVGAHVQVIPAWIRELLHSKRFQIQIETDLGSFVKSLPDASEAWIISGSEDGTKGGVKQDWSSVSQADFVQAMTDYHHSGRGLALFASGDPLVCEANVILSSLFEIKLTGSTEGKGDLKVKPNPVMSGVTSLYEGIKVSYPEMDNTEGFKVLATSTANHPTVFVKDMQRSFPSTGRVVVDTGYSKMMHIGNRDVVKYMCNVAVWLLSIDYRIRKNCELRGTLIPKEDIEYIWQYHHGGWYNYDAPASKIVEDHYKEYLNNPGKNDVRSVHSGHWNYLVDFLNMMQTNIQHEDHTQRRIRRVPKTQGIV